jgi:tetratricopeptide (TPR) repeat protein
MDLRSKPQLPVFNLLSIGQRGVGKTVFLAGSYAELHRQSQQETVPEWTFECQDSEDWQKLQTIFEYIANTGQYPPPTMKVTDFHFSLQRCRRGLPQTVCEFCWWDIPGEECDFQQPEFQKIVLNSHSCCVFLNGEKLVKDAAYQQKIESLKKQVMAIASSVDFRKFSYAFAIIITQCDRLDGGAIARLQIQEKLQDFTASLKSLNAKYQCFYSGIPIVAEDESFTLAPTGAAYALLWLVSELEKTHKHDASQTLEAALQANPLPTRKRFALPHAAFLGGGIVAGLAAIGVAGWFAFSHLTPQTGQIRSSDPEIQQYEEKLRRNPDDSSSLKALANIYLERGQLNEALPLLEKIAQQQPESLDWQLNLAYLYTLKPDLRKAEVIYEQILAKDKANLQALLGKATLRSQQGDSQTAQQFFEQAESAAGSSELKAQIREMAQRSLGKGK